MRRLLIWGAVGFIAVVVWVAWMVRTPDAAEGYAEKYGGSVSQYDALLTSTDCAWLASRIRAEADSQAAYGYQRAANDRMVSLDC